MSVAWVVLAQGICGVAKDLTKTASKSAIKLTAGERLGPAVQVGGLLHRQQERDEGRGLLPGRLLLQALGFQQALWAMAGLLALVLVGVSLRAAADGQEQGVEVGQGAVRQEPRHQPAGRRPRGAVRRARRVVRGRRAGVPVRGGLDFTMVGGFLALWTIGYGAGAGLAPAIVRRSDDGLSTEVPAARLWSAAAGVVPMGAGVLVLMKVPHLEWVVVGGLGVFGFAFAVNSSVHSYLVLAYAGSEKAAEDVGFYYAANALGRFFGTLMSGLLYQWGGLSWSLPGRRRCCGLLAGHAGAAFHVKELLHAGLLTQERDGRHLIYRPSIVTMNALLAYLSAHCCQAVTCDATPVSAGTACTTC
jgi:hypothetical protein